MEYRIWDMGIGCEIRDRIWNKEIEYINCITSSLLYDSCLTLGSFSTFIIEDICISHQALTSMLKMG